MEWRKTILFPGINALDFCYAFDNKQALTLLQYFQNDHSVKVVLVDAEFLKDPTAPGAQEFFKQLEAQSHTLLLSITDETFPWPIKQKVLKHVRRNNRNTLTRKRNERAERQTVDSV